METLADSEALGDWLAEILLDILAEILAEGLLEILAEVLADGLKEILADSEALGLWDADGLLEIDDEIDKDPNWSKIMSVSSSNKFW